MSGVTPTFSAFSLSISGVYDGRGRIEESECSRRSLGPLLALRNERDYRLAESTGPSPPRSSTIILT